MSRLDVAVIKIDPFTKHAALTKISGQNLASAVRRITGARQLGHKILMNIEEQRIMGQRAGEYGKTVNYDAGPTPLVVATDAEQEKGVPGFRIGGTVTAGISVLFGKGLHGMVNVPVNLQWIAENLEWVEAEVADLDDADAE